jgi:predicted small integral membrane protein
MLTLILKAYFFTYGVTIVLIIVFTLVIMYQNNYVFSSMLVHFPGDIMRLYRSILSKPHVA